MEMVKTRMLVSVLAVLLMVAVSYGDLIAYEPFNYAAGPLANLNGGYGFANAWQPSGSGTSAEIDDGTGGWGALPAPDGADNLEPSHARFWGSGATGAIMRDLAAPLDFAPAQEATYYFSMLFRRTDTSNGGGTESVRFFDFRDDASSGTPLMIAGATSTEQGWALLGGYGNDNTSAGAAYQVTASGDSIHNHMVLAKLVTRASGNDTLSMKYYEAGIDTVGATEPTVWDVEYQNDVSGTSATFLLSVQKFGGAVHVDELRIATDYTNAIPVPEPASIGLLTLGLLALRKTRK